MDSRSRNLRPSAEEIFAALEPFTGPLDAATRTDLDDEVHWFAVHRGSEIIKQGAAGDCVFFVLSGRLEVLIDHGDGTTSSIAEIGPGESVGEAALLTNEPRGATVRVLRDSELLRLSRLGFERLLAAHPRTMAGFARTVASRLQRSLRQREPVQRLRFSSLATPEDCEAIVRTEHVVLRNLKITQMYHRLSLDIARLVGQRDANWCTFATSASKTAGYSIRREEMPFLDTWQKLCSVPRIGTLLEPFGQTLASVSASVGLSERIDAILDDVSAHISAGNLKVFAELGPLFAKFVARFHDSPEYERAALVAFLDETLLVGPTELGGQDLLREALTHYYDAMFEQSEKARAELMLLGNLKIGWHEQMRLQPQIEAALNVPIEVGLRGAVAFRGGERLERRIAEAIRKPMREMATRLLMRLRLPRGDMRLGRDVPAVHRRSMFPDVLRTLHNAELVALVAKLDNDVDTCVGSYASDWASLEQRMNFIVDLFRTRQRSLDLFESPFEYDQRLQMEAERIPHGRL